MNNQKTSFWTSLPALLTAVATLIAALTGAVALYLNSRADDNAPAVSNTQSSESQPSHEFGIENETSSRTGNLEPSAPGGPQFPVPGGNLPPGPGGQKPPLPPLP